MRTSRKLKTRKARHRVIGTASCIGVLLFGSGLFPGGLAVLSLEQAVSEALAENPGLAALKARAEALAQVAPQQQTLPDPHLRLRLANLPTDTFSLSQEPMTQAQLSLSQTLPYPGKLELRERVAAFDGEAGMEQFQEGRVVLIRDVKTVWWNLFYLDRALEINDRNQDLLRQFLKIAESKYEVGSGLQQDVLLAQLELSKLVDARIVLVNARHNEQARLNALLNRNAEELVALPSSVASGERHPALQEALVAKALAERPLLRSRRRRLGAAELRVSLARKDYRPDFTIGGGYGYRDGVNQEGSDRADFVSLVVGINLPYFTRKRQDAALAQRLQEKLQHERTLADEQRRVEAAVSNALADYRRAEEQVRLFDSGILPQARQTVNSMLAGYQVNKVDFLNLVSAETSLYNYEALYWMAVSRVNQALARLVAAVGTENIDE